MLNSHKDKNYYARLNKFYNSFNSLYNDWIKDVKMEKYKHPYAKFDRKDDKLYQHFVKKTERYEKNKHSISK